MSLESGILYFNKQSSQFISKTSVRGKGNQHDESKGVDLKINDEYIKNGVDNFFPFDIIETAKRSMLQKRAFRTITNIINGRLMFQNSDGSAVSENRERELLELYKSINIDKTNFLTPVVNSNYLQGGAFISLQWSSNGRELALDSVVPRSYQTARLSFPVWDKTKYVYPKHFYHRTWGYKHEKKRYGGYTKVQVSKKTKSWLEWNKDPVKNFDEPCFIYSYNKGLDKRRDVNRVQSYLIADYDGLSEYYPEPVWFSGTVYNYERAEFFLSCFDIDDIENGLHASGVVKVFHQSYVDPESGEAKQTFEQHVKMIENKFRGSFNSGSVAIVPVGLDPDGNLRPTNDFMEFEPLKTNNNKDRHDTFDKRIMNKILGANGIIMPELLGIRDEKSTLSESGQKLVNAVKLLNQFTIKPQKSLIESFLNDIVNNELEIDEKVVVVPNLRAFLSISDELAKHYLHPDDWYKLYIDFGLSIPTIEQKESELIPAYIKNNQNSVNNNGNLQ